MESQNGHAHKQKLMVQNSCVAVVANGAPPNITNIQPSCQVGHVGAAIFHFNMAAQIGSMAQ